MCFSCGDMLFSGFVVPNGGLSVVFRHPETIFVYESKSELPDFIPTFSSKPIPANGDGEALPYPIAKVVSKPNRLLRVSIPFASKRLPNFDRFRIITAFIGIHALLKGGGSASCADVNE